MNKILKFNQDSGFRAHSKKKKKGISLISRFLMELSEMRKHSWQSAAHFMQSPGLCKVPLFVNFQSKTVDPLILPFLVLNY